MIFLPGDLWKSKKIDKIFSSENQIETMQKVEIALAKAEAEFGIIPKEAAADIANKGCIKYVDLDIYDEYLNSTGGLYIMALLKAWEPSLEKNNAQYLHWGATTQDISDTTDVLKFRKVYEVIYTELQDVIDILKNMSLKYKRTPLPGRTHTQHAVPTTFGLKTAVWFREMQRHMQRMDDCSKRLFTCCLYGAAGNLASLGSGSLKVNELMAKNLGLNFEPIPWHTARDNFTELINIFANIASTFGKIGNEICQLASTEIAEVEEPWTYGNCGSSTMPQKRNPEGSEAMVVLAKLIQFNAGAVYQAMMHEHERDSRAWNIEQFVFPMVSSMTEKIINYGQLILKDLVVYPERMRSNLDLTHGLIMCESLMMKFGAKVGRLNAHKIVYDLAVKAYSEKVHLKELVLQNKEIMKNMTVDEVEHCFEPTNYVGEAYNMVDLAVKGCKK